MSNVIKNKILLIVSAAILLMASVLAMPMLAGAAPNEKLNPDGSVRCGSDIDIAGTDCAKTKASTDINDLIKTVINIFSAVVGAVSVIMIIVGGFRYIISGGDSNNVGAAKNTILYAVVGLVIVAIAQIIVQFVLERTT